MAETDVQEAPQATSGDQESHWLCCEKDSLLAMCGVVVGEDAVDGKPITCKICIDRDKRSWVMDDDPSDGLCPLCPRRLLGDL